MAAISASSSELMNQVATSIAEATNEPFTPSSFSGGGGGDWASTGTIIDEKQQKEYFVKSSNMGGYAMLNAEFEGIKDIYDSKTIRVPRPICKGSSDANFYIVFEKLALGGRGDGLQFAKDLCAMHKTTSPNGMYGWKINNTCGATVQINTWTETWPEFWDQHRLGHILGLSKRKGAKFEEEVELREKVKELLHQHTVVPSLVHGDLWSGNSAYTQDGNPVIFDPATYYGDREVDIAMTKLFGFQSREFYETYNKEWPLEEGYELRETIYNLYHILNHYVLFGGGYLSKAKSMITRILDS
jgi:fructosamine-3-kinase